MKVSASTATTLLLAAVVLAAAGFAIFGSPPSSDSPHAATAPQEELPSGDTMPELPQEDPEGLNAEAPGEGQDIAPDDEPAAIEWSIPAGWRILPNPSPIRIATYLVPRAAGDGADAEVSVSRAGGDESANIQRWVDQFEAASQPKRRAQKVRGLDVTLVEIEGTYTSTMDPSAGPRPGWALLAAIVRSPGQPYFFKMIGPAATVHGARTSFAKLVESIQPAE